MLIHHADAHFDGGIGVVDVDFLTVQEDPALVGLLDTEEDLHQGTLTGAVLAHQSVDLALIDGEGHIFICNKTVGIYLADVLHYEDILFHVHPPKHKVVASHPAVLGFRRAGCGAGQAPFPKTGRAKQGHRAEGFVKSPGGAFAFPWGKVARAFARDG